MRTRLHNYHIKKEGGTEIVKKEITIIIHCNFLLHPYLKVELSLVMKVATPGRLSTYAKDTQRSDSGGCGSGSAPPGKLVGAGRHVLWQPRHDLHRVGLAFVTEDSGLFSRKSKKCHEFSCKTHGILFCPSRFHNCFIKMFDYKVSGTFKCNF